jgi:hypothetical protein
VVIHRPPLGVVEAGEETSGTVVTCIHEKKLI